MDRFEVVVGSGTCRTETHRTVQLLHRWTSEGVAVETDFTGAHLLHLAVAGCVLNDVHREAERLGIQVDGVLVSAGGSFDSSWASTGVEYSVQVDSPAPADEVTRLLGLVDQVAEIPRALRAGAAVERVDRGPWSG